MLACYSIIVSQISTNYKYTNKNYYTYAKNNKRITKIKYKN